MDMGLYVMGFGKSFSVVLDMGLLDITRSLANVFVISFSAVLYMQPRHFLLGYVIKSVRSVRTPISWHGVYKNVAMVVFSCLQSHIYVYIY